MIMMTDDDCRDNEADDRCWLIMMTITMIIGDGIGNTSYKKKQFSFGHWPNYLLPPPPNSGKLYNFYWTSKTTFSAYYRTK